METKNDAKGCELMIVFVTKTSECSKGEVMEFSNLEEAVNKLLSDRDAFEIFKSDPLELIISKPYINSPESHRACDYVIELYDDWRE